MKAKDPALRYYIGWDVGGWNCDSNPRSRDALVILDSSLAMVGKPWRGNLRDAITESQNSHDWLQALFKLCGASLPSLPPVVTLAIDAPLGFSEEFVSLVTRTGFAEASKESRENRYLFRRTERALFGDEQTPLSAVKDMIGSQATKGMHVLAKFAPKVQSCGVWTDNKGLRVIETYPAACKDRMPSEASWIGLRSLGHEDKDDARVCALIAYLFAEHSELLEKPPADVPHAEGWIWVPKSREG